LTDFKFKIWWETQGKIVKKKSKVDNFTDCKPLPDSRNIFKRTLKEMLPGIKKDFVGKQCL
jgi:hypothetical protein